MTPWRRLLFAVAVLLPGTADAQEASPGSTAPPMERERSSFIVFSPGRIGSLIPINDRWMIRPDFGGELWRTGEPASHEVIIAGVSVVRRSAPRDGGWVYGALRYGIEYENANLWDEANLAHIATATIGAHARVLDWLGAFGESGVYFRYFDDAWVNDRRINISGGMTSRIGLALQRPRRAPQANATSAVSEVRAQDHDRPSWIVGGFGEAGLLLPLEGPWLLRPDLNASAISNRQGYSGTRVDAGVSLLRSTEPTERAWAYTAIRYGLGYHQVDARYPSWSHSGSVTAGGHLRLRDRFGVFAEAGFQVRYAEQRGTGAKYTVVTGRPIQRVGVTIRWNDRAP